MLVPYAAAAAAAAADLCPSRSRRWHPLLSRYSPASQARQPDSGNNDDDDDDDDDVVVDDDDDDDARPSRQQN